MTYITYRVSTFKDGEYTGDDYFPCGSALDALVQSLHEKGLEVTIETEVAYAYETEVAYA